MVNNRIVNIFRKKIALLYGKIKAARKKSGTCVKRLLNRWKKSTYEFTVYYHEVDKCALQLENQTLLGQKRVLEEDVVNEVAKRMKVQEKLEQALSKTEKSASYYKKRFKNIVKKVINKQKRAPQKNKRYHESG